MTSLRIFFVLLAASAAALCVSSTGCFLSGEDNPDADVKKTNSKCPQVPESPPYAELAIEGLNLNQSNSRKEVKDEKGRVVGHLNVNTSRRKDGLVHVAFDFGAMELGSTKSHTFKITNQGEGPLEVVKHSSTCQCTVAGVGKSGLKKGASTEIKLEWTAKSPSPRFEQTAELCTNDPKCKRIGLTVTGNIVQNVEVVEGPQWSFNTIDDDATPEPLTRHIVSRIRDEFEITGLEYPEDKLKIQTEKLTAKELGNLNAINAFNTTLGPPKSGYRLTVKLLPSNDVGRFEHNLKIKVKAGKEAEFPVHIVGSRTGPISITKGIGPGRFSESRVLLHIGDFPATKGVSSSLHLYVSGLGDKELKVESHTSDPDFIQVKLEPVEIKSASDKKSPAKQSRNKQYRLTFTIPPYPENRPRNVYTALKPGKVTIQTNHPKAEAITISLQFNPRREQ